MLDDYTHTYIYGRTYLKFILHAIDENGYGR